MNIVVLYYTHFIFGEAFQKSLVFSSVTRIRFNWTYMSEIFQWNDCLGVFHCSGQFVAPVLGASDLSQAKSSQSLNAINCTPRRDEEVTLIASNGHHVWVCQSTSYQGHLFIIIHPSLNGLQCSINLRLYAFSPRLISHLSINLTIHQFHRHPLIAEATFTL